MFGPFSVFDNKYVLVCALHVKLLAGVALQPLAIGTDVVQLFAVGFDLLLVMADLTLQAADLFVVRISLVEVAVAHHEGDEEEKDNELFGIFHCFSGNKQQAEQAISYGLKLGIGGVVTFKNGKLDTFLNEIPLENIVLETDAPYLAPVPFRGKRNESSYLTYVIKKLSELYEVSENEIVKQTTTNALKIFKL